MKALGKVLGLDLGTKRMGVAISDSMQMLASAYDVIEFKDGHFIHALEALRPIIEANNIKVVVLGYPKNMSNTASVMTKHCDNFKKKLISMYGVEVILVDERMTSMMASRTLMDANVKGKNKKKVIDKVAATIILQSYLDIK